MDFVPATERAEPVARERPRRTLGLESAHPAFASMYRQISGSYRSLEPLVLDLPEYTPGLTRPDLMQAEPRREMIRTAIRQAFGRALMDALSAEAERVTGKRWFPRVEPPVDTTPERALATSSLPPPAPIPTTPPRYIFGVSHMRTVLAGIDIAGFSLHADVTARGAGGSRVWAVAPLRGPGMQGNVGVSSAGEVFVSLWLRF